MSGNIITDADIAVVEATRLVQSAPQNAEQSAPQNAEQSAPQNAEQTNEQSVNSQAEASENNKGIRGNGRQNYRGSNRGRGGYRGRGSYNNRPDYRPDHRLDRPNNRPDSRPDNRPNNQHPNNGNNHLDNNSRPDHRPDHKPDYKPDHRPNHRPGNSHTYMERRQQETIKNLTKMVEQLKLTIETQNKTINAMTEDLNNLNSNTQCPQNCIVPSPSVTVFAYNQSGVFKEFTFFADSPTVCVTVGLDFNALKGETAVNYIANQRENMSNGNQAAMDT